MKTIMYRRGRTIKYYMILVILSILLLVVLSSYLITKKNNNKIDLENEKKEITINDNSETSSDKVTDFENEDKPKGSFENSSKNTINFLDQSTTIKEMMLLVEKIPYNYNLRFDDKGNLAETSSFGLIQYFYSVYTQDREKFLKESEIDNWMKVDKDSLEFGDIGIYKINDKKIYGVCVGTLSDVPMFMYIAPIPNENFVLGSVSLSFLKSEYNIMYYDMFPMDFNEFYRFPDTTINNELLDLMEFIPNDIKLLDEEIDYTNMVYKIGQWIETNDIDKSYENLAINGLKTAGYTMSKETFNKTIIDLNNMYGNKFLFHLKDYICYDIYTVIDVEIIEEDEFLTYKKFPYQLTITIYPDGTFILGNAAQIEPAALIYGYRKIKSSITANDENIEEKSQKNESKRNITVIVDEDSTYDSEKGIIYKNGMSIDINKQLKEIEEME